MAIVVSLSGSPSENSRTARLARYLDVRLVRHGHEVIPLDVRTIPADALQFAFAGKTVLPPAAGGTTAHVLAIDYALRPALSSLGATHIVPGWFVLDTDIVVVGETVTLAPAAEAALIHIVDQFSDALSRRPALQVADR